LIARLRHQTTISNAESTKPRDKLNHGHRAQKRKHKQRGVVLEIPENHLHNDENGERDTRETPSQRRVKQYEARVIRFLPR
jgi:hypothetical protein